MSHYPVQILIAYFPLRSLRHLDVMQKCAIGKILCVYLPFPIVTRFAVQWNLQRHICNVRAREVRICNRRGNKRHRTQIAHSLHFFGIRLVFLFDALHNDKKTNYALEGYRSRERGREWITKLPMLGPFSVPNRKRSKLRSVTFRNF